MKKVYKGNNKIRDSAMNVDEFALDLMAILCDRIQKNVQNISTARYMVEETIKDRPDEHKKYRRRIRDLGVENRAYYKVIKLILNRQALDEYLFYKRLDAGRKEKKQLEVYQDQK